MHKKREEEEDDDDDFTIESSDIFFPFLSIPWITDRFCPEGTRNPAVSMMTG